MKTLKYMLESSLLDIDGTMKEGDKYNKDITEFFDEINKHLKNVKLWNIKRSKFNNEWVCFNFKVPMNETILKLISEPFKLKQGWYKTENLYIEVNTLWNQYEGEAECHIELMLKNTVGIDIMVRYSGKIFKPNFNTKTPDILDDKIMINGLLKPAIKNVFKPALKDIDTLIEFMTTNFD